MTLVIEPTRIDLPAYRYLITKPWCSQGLELYEILKTYQATSQIIINEELDEKYAFNETALQFMAKLPALCKHIVHYTLIYISLQVIQLIPQNLWHSMVNIIWI